MRGALPAPVQPIDARLGLLAVASLAVFIAYPLGETLEFELGVFDFGLSLPPSLLRGKTVGIDATTCSL